MPVLPLIDLLIMAGWTSLMGAGLLKAIYLSTLYRPKILGLGPGDFLVFAGISLLFALTLAARTWVKYHEPSLMARRSRVQGALSAEERRAEMASIHAATPRAADGS